MVATAKPKAVSKSPTKANKPAWTAMGIISLSTVGTTRLVLVIGPWAFKLARGARGRRCNSYEANLFQNVNARRSAMLCPVLWCAGSGWLMVMSAATPLAEHEKEELLDSNGFPDWDYMPGEASDPFEYKASDWGRINGRLVALDYSTPAHCTVAELAELRRAACGE
jgi:hypothetical protein